MENLSDHAVQTIISTPDFGPRSRPRWIQTWKCRYCESQWEIEWDDTAPVRRHLRSKHRAQYIPHTIQEVSDE